MGAGPADDRRDTAIVAVHQTGPPAPRASRPTGRSGRAGWSRGMGTDQSIELLRLLKQASADLGVRAWVVGGYVRDKILGRPHPNPDVVVEGGDALKLAERFAELAGAGRPVTFERFGTAQVTLPGHLVEFVTARAESYSPDSRKPDVRPATLEEDLRRRDLTVNTLLLDFAGEVHDVLGERTADELRRMLTSDRPRLAIELLAAGELLETILPEVAACRGVTQTGYHTHDVYGHTLLVLERVPGDLVLRLAALFHDVGKPSTATPDGAFTGHENAGAEMARSALERLRFSQKEIETVVKLVRLHLRPVYYRSEWTDGAVRRLARDAGAQLDGLMALAHAD